MFTKSLFSLRMSTCVSSCCTGVRWLDRQMATRNCSVTVLPEPSICMSWDPETSIHFLWKRHLETHTVKKSQKMQHRYQIPPSWDIHWLSRQLNAELTSKQVKMGFIQPKRRKGQHCNANCGTLYQIHIFLWNTRNILWTNVLLNLPFLAFFLFLERNEDM